MSCGSTPGTARSSAGSARSAGAGGSAARPTLATLDGAQGAAAAGAAAPARAPARRAVNHAAVGALTRAGAPARAARRVVGFVGFVVHCFATSSRFACAAAQRHDGVTTTRRAAAPGPRRGTAPRDAPQRAAPARGAHPGGAVAERRRLALARSGTGWHAARRRRRDVDVVGRAGTDEIGARGRPTEGPGLSWCSRSARSEAEVHAPGRVRGVAGARPRGRAEAQARGGGGRRAAPKGPRDARPTT